MNGRRRAEEEMADTHEEQLLSELLSSIARDDERLEAAHLESRVMATLDTSPAPWFRPNTDARRHRRGGCDGRARTGIAWVVREAPPAVSEMRVEPLQQKAVDTPAASAKPSAHAQPTSRPALSRPTTRMKQAPDARAASAEPPNHQSAITPIAQSPITQSPDAFMPLMPMTEQELRGSFQLVRVQMPRASLGALRSPLDHPNELVEADVLAGRGRNGARHSRLHQRIDLSLEVSMNRRLSLIMLIVLSCALSVRAQGQPDVFTYASPINIEFMSGPIALDTEPVTGAPYSAEAVTDVVQQLADGNRIVRQNKAQISRDGQGRTRREQGFAMFGPLVNGPRGNEMRNVQISDPTTGTMVMLDLNSRTAHRMPGAPRMMMGNRIAMGGAEHQCRRQCPEVRIRSAAVA